MGHRIEVMSDGSVDLSVKEGLATRRPIRVYNIDDDLTLEELARVKDELLADPISDVGFVDQPFFNFLPANSVIIEQSPKIGVTDPEGAETRKAISRMLGREIGSVTYSTQHLYIGELDENKTVGLKKRVGKPLVDDFILVQSSEWNPRIGAGFHFNRVNLPKPKPFDYIDIEIPDSTLEKISRDRLLELSLDEMHSIQRELFRDSNFLAERARIGLEGRPTDAEWEIFGQKWSDHCCHKTFNAEYHYTSDDPNDESGLPTVINSAFKSIIKPSTYTIINDRNFDWVVSVFEDNSGVIRLNDRINVAQKIETHNHPTALEPYGGSNTGIGGVIRDPMSTGIGMNPCSNQYHFNVAYVGVGGYTDLPPEIVGPFEVLVGMVAGVEDYGNKMGIPTALGHVTMDNGWLKCACYVGTTAYAPAEINGRKTHVKDIRPGDLILSLGGGVGRDGVHGATGSSTDLSASAEQSSQVNQTVQIGNPITEKNVLEYMMLMRDYGKIKAAQDCGAGGWNSAIEELTALLNELEEKRFAIKRRFTERGIGSECRLEERLEAVADIIDINKKASPFIDELKYEIQSGDILNYNGAGKGGSKVDFTHAPEKYQGLVSWEKIISEAQEREVIVIDPKDLDYAMKLGEHMNVPVTVMGRFDGTGMYHLIDQDQTVAYLPVSFMNRGLPQRTIKAHWTPCKNSEPELSEIEDYTDVVLKIIGNPNLQIYDEIIRRFDHEVQGGSLTKPLCGIGKGRNPANSFAPVPGEKEVIIESYGTNPWQGDIDAYHMGRNNVIDAIGKIIAAGGNLERIAFNGNTTCPKPANDPYVAAQVLRMLKGSADAEVAMGTPRISGKDSPSMERKYISTKTGQEVTVKAKPELLMSGMGVVGDDSTLTTPDFKYAGDYIYVVGETRDELGASEFYRHHGVVGRNIPRTDFNEFISRGNTVSYAVQNGLVESLHYIERFGLTYALANSAIGGDLGVKVELSHIDNNLGRASKILFSETTGRYLVSVKPENAEAFEASMNGVYCRRIGEVTKDKYCDVTYNGKSVFGCSVSKLRTANRGEVRINR